MRKNQKNSTSRTNRFGRRQLATEQLERREMLAADFMNAGAAFGDVGSGGESSAEPSYVNVSSSASQGNGQTSTSNGKGSGSNGSQQPGQGQSGQGQSGENQVQNELSAFEIESLLHMREEEKLARDVYVALGDRWDVPIFDNIAEAESKHMESMLQLIDKYGLEDPVGDNAPGEFTNPAFETLYDDLVEMGSESLLAAYKVGALIEELDISDLQNALENVDHDDIEEAYENLLRGSRNHLRSFAAQIAAAGSTYDAQYLTQAEFDAIANSPRETGNDQGGSNPDPTERPAYRPAPRIYPESVSQSDQDSDLDRDNEQERIRDRLFSQLGSRQRGSRF